MLQSLNRAPAQAAVEKTPTASQDLARDMHEGFKSIIAPLLQLAFAGANLERGGQVEPATMKDLKLPPKPTSEGSAFFSVDRFRKDREILLAAIAAQGAQSAQQGSKIAAHKYESSSELKA